MKSAFSRLASLTGAALLLASALWAAPVYRDLSVSVDARVADLLGRMTAEEKFWQLFLLAGEAEGDPARFEHGIHGLQLPVGAGPESFVEHANRLQRHFVQETRLGIPALLVAEALHGLVQQEATVFPQAIGLAATFDPDLLGEVAAAIANECRARGVRQALSPMINLATDVRWGRVEESYGEDPFLASAMAAAFVGACESRGVATTPKHFVANVGDGGRDSWPVEISELALRERHLPPFVAALDAGARSVMTAYNSWNGAPCTASDFLQNRLLKDELGFRGVVLSDAGAVGGANVLHFTASDYEDATARAMLGGLDVIFQTSIAHETLFAPPFLDGRVPPAVVDSAVARVLRLKFELGLFERPFLDADAWPEPHGPASVELARRAAEESIVLLKNAGGALPFGDGIRSIAVIGPDADEARLGGYSAPSTQAVTLLEGLRRRAGEGVVVRHARGCDRDPQPFPTVPAEALSHAESDGEAPGLSGAYYANDRLEGPPRFERVDGAVRFDWRLFCPDPERLPADDYSVRWTGWLRAPASGRFRLGIEGDEGFRMFLDDSLLLDRWWPVTAGRRLAEVELLAGQARRLRLEFHDSAGGAKLRLVWDVDAANEDAALDEALVLAASCDATVLAVGIEEGEFRDRASLALPGRQEELILRVAALGKPLVVVLTGGSAVTMERWLERAPAVLAAWYPGEQGGAALAAVLFGDADPGGRLPITFPQAEGQLPLVHDHKPTGRGDDYADLSGRALFPFGHGLSYGEFEYSGLTVEPAVIGPDGRASVRFKVTNVGERAGEAVPQLYLRDRLASVARPVQQLKGFQRTRLEPGESRELRFEIGPAALTMLDAELRPVVEPGEFRIRVGSSSRDIRLKGLLTVEER